VIQQLIVVAGERHKRAPLRRRTECAATVETTGAAAI